MQALSNQEIRIQFRNYILSGKHHSAIEFMSKALSKDKADIILYRDYIEYLISVRAFNMAIEKSDDLITLHGSKWGGIKLKLS